MIFSKELTYFPFAQKAAVKYNVPVSLILGHIKQESNFDPNAYRNEPAIKDASYGLMQILVGTARGMDSSSTAGKLLDPDYNVDLGTRLIAKNLIRYGGDVKSEAAAYNAGTAYKDASGNYISKSGNTAVQGYVDKVYSNYQYYMKWLASGAKEVDVTMINPVLAIGFVALSGIVFGTYYYMQKNKGGRYVSVR